MTLKATPSNPPQAGNSQEKQASAAIDAQQLLRSQRKASLGTVDRSSGHPHVSLVTVATEPDGSPILLISRLAVHTQNLMADPRASLMFDGTDSKGDPLAGGRVTAIGQAQKTDSATARRRFLARHPEAADYADFPDFAFYVLQVERAHYIGGFGRIVTLPGEQVLTAVSGAASLIESEADVVEHMNDDHSDAVQLYATVLAGRAAGAWRMTGIDPDGVDLAEEAGDTCRVMFDGAIATAQDARRELIKLVKRARGE